MDFFKSDPYSVSNRLKNQTASQRLHSTLSDILKRSDNKSEPHSVVSPQRQDSRAQRKIESNRMMNRFEDNDDIASLSVIKIDNRPGDGGNSALPKTRHSALHGNDNTKQRSVRMYSGDSGLISSTSLEKRIDESEERAIQKDRLENDSSSDDDVEMQRPADRGYNFIEPRVQSQSQIESESDNDDDPLSGIKFLRLDMNIGEKECNAHGPDVNEDDTYKLAGSDGKRGFEVDDRYMILMAADLDSIEDTDEDTTRSTISDLQPNEDISEIAEEYSNLSEDFQQDFEEIHEESETDVWRQQQQQQEISLNESSMIETDITPSSISEISFHEESVSDALEDKGSSYHFSNSKSVWDTSHNSTLTSFYDDFEEEFESANSTISSLETTLHQKITQQTQPISKPAKPQTPKTHIQQHHDQSANEHKQRTEKHDPQLTDSEVLENLKIQANQIREKISMLERRREKKSTAVQTTEKTTQIHSSFFPPSHGHGSWVFNLSNPTISVACVYHSRRARIDLTSDKL